MFHYASGLVLNKVCNKPKVQGHTIIQDTSVLALDHPIANTTTLLSE